MQSWNWFLVIPTHRYAYNTKKKKRFPKFKKLYLFFIDRCICILYENRIRNALYIGLANVSGITGISLYSREHIKTASNFYFILFILLIFQFNFYC